MKHGITTVVFLYTVRDFIEKNKKIETSFRPDNKKNMKFRFLKRKKQKGLLRKYMKLCFCETRKLTKQHLRFYNLKKEKTGIFLS